MDTSKVVIAVVILLLLGGGAYFYFQNNESMKTGTEQTQMMASMAPGASSEPLVSDHGMMASDEGSMEAGVKEFTVDGSNFKFEPATMSVNKGDKVKITFKNTGGFHDFVIDELSVKTKQIGANASETVEFTADKVGNFEYYCSVGNHRGMGMKGTLTVK